jgi:hypothetical protein
MHRAPAEGFGHQNGRVEGGELADYLRDRPPPDTLRLAKGQWRQTPKLDGLDHMLWVPVTRATAAAP